MATKLRILEVVMAVRFLVAYCLPDSALVCFPCIETVAEANAGLLFLCFFSLIEHEQQEIYHFNIENYRFAMKLLTLGILKKKISVCSHLIATLKIIASR